MLSTSSAKFMNLLKLENQRPKKHAIDECLCLVHVVGRGGLLFFLKNASSCNCFVFQRQQKISARLLVQIFVRWPQFRVYADIIPSYIPQSQQQWRLDYCMNRH
jgi:hypothetical protein